MKMIKNIILMVLVLSFTTMIGCKLGPQPMSGGHYANPYDDCVANMVVLSGGVTTPHIVLGMIQGSGTVFASLGKKTAIRNAIWEACRKYPDGDAIINFMGDSQGSSVYYSGIVVKWVK